jgi:hypothetical protein
MHLSENRIFIGLFSCKQRHCCKYSSLEKKIRASAPHNSRLDNGRRVAGASACARGAARKRRAPPLPQRLPPAVPAAGPLRVRAGGGSPAVVVVASLDGTN